MVDIATYDKASEAGTLLESSIFDTRHALGDGGGGEAAAIIESIVSYGRHTLGDGDGGEAAAIIEG